MRIFASTSSLLATGLLACSLTGCVVAPPRAQVQPQPVVVAPAQRIEFGRVANMELLQTQERPQTSGAGAVIGGIAGAVLGHQIGGGSGRSAATVLGAFGGAIAGNSIEGNQQPAQVHASYRVTVQAEDGSYRYFSVATPTDLRVGDHVRMAGGQLYRY